MSGRSDASTSTDDVKARPLSLFYFASPFGVLSAEPPRVCDMQRAAAGWGWPAAAERSAATGAGLELGAAAVFARARPVRPAPDLWLEPAPRRLQPLLPPLRLPSARALSASPDDVWPRRPPPADRFSLPPIELPAPARPPSAGPPSPAPATAGSREPRPRRLGVDKQRRRRRRVAHADVRRALAALTRRPVAERRGCGRGRGSPAAALARALRTLRHAWPDHSRFLSRCVQAGAARPRPARAMLSPRSPHASPGLLRRRYSVPETIMRKYRLAQQSDSEESAAPAHASAASASASPAREPDSPQRFLRRDRELMRKSALLRRMWARPCAGACCSPPGSRSELWPRRDAPASLSDYTLASRCGDTSDADSRPPAEERAEPPSSETLTVAKETDASTEEPSGGERIEGRVSERSAGADNDERNASYERALTVEARSPPLYELLEVVVSESGRRAPPAARAARPAPPAPDDIDRYVADVLVESLNSLSDQLECIAAVGGERRISVVEKEIKVRLQNAAVNTVVHLSPTSNHQIIFGNEELGGDGPRPEEERCQADGSLAVREEPGSPDSAPPAPAPNLAVLHQIRQLFRDERREPAPAEGSGGDEQCAELETGRAGRRALAAAGAGNYRGGDEPRAVPRYCARPHSDSMEVNASSSGSSEAARSECASLVDSLDDPRSPRAPPPRAPELARSPLDVLELLPEGARAASADSRGEAFFVRIEDDGREPADTVAAHMPDDMKRRLHRRHRQRELRVECARRSKVKQLKRELERRRLDEEAAARRQLERDAAAVVDALLDDVVARLARDECARAARAGAGRRPPARRARRPAPPAPPAPAARLVRGRLLARPSPPPAARPPRRIYQKSEIREGEKCIEILEILEYVTGSPSSPETASDESHERAVRGWKSRIPVPVAERAGAGRMRLTGGGARSPPASLAGLLLRALAEPAPAPAPPEPRERSGSLRFKRVFDVIPEERSGLSFDSSAEEAEQARRASVPEAAGGSPRRAAPTRSAGTSPPAPAGEPVQRALRSQTTMTSPRCRSAATSPLRAPPPPPRPARPPREGRAGSRAGAAQERLGSSSDSGDSGGSLLCSLAPRWLSAQARQRRRARRTPRAPPAPPARTGPAGVGGALRGSPVPAAAAPAAPGGWSVTVAGSCRAALPADVEMRLRFPHEAAGVAVPRCPACGCAQCTACSARAALPPAEPAPDPRLTLTMKKEAQDSSLVATKSVKKSGEQLPELETYRASRTKLKSSVKTRRGYSLQCWLGGAGARAPPAPRDPLSVLGCAIIPELKPRVPTMSERDLTRVYTPRHYLRS